MRPYTHIRRGNSLVAPRDACHTVCMRRLTHLIVLAAFVFSCGGQWAAFQTIAWANMIREYSQMVPLKQAVQMTFSGDYPCKICKALAEQKTSDQQKSFSLEKFDKKFLPLIAARQFVLSSQSISYFSHSPLLNFRKDVPAIRPPRSAVI